MNTPLGNRRRALQWLGSAGATGLLGACAMTSPSPDMPVKKLGRVMVVGAGFGGATAAKYLKYWGGPGIEVVLVDRNPQFVSCPLSNLVLGGSRTLADITVGYQGLRELGVIVLNDEVASIDTSRKKVVLKKIADQSYDRLIVAPGVDFNFGAIQGLDAQAQTTVLHAWKAGQQTLDLRRQLEAMPDGGVFVMTIPQAPYRCPPGPYERACQVAHYFKTRKPRDHVEEGSVHQGVQRAVRRHRRVPRQQQRDRNRCAQPHRDHRSGRPCPRRCPERDPASWRG